MQVKVGIFGPSFSADPNLWLTWLGKLENKGVFLDWIQLCTEHGSTKEEYHCVVVYILLYIYCSSIYISNFIMVVGEVGSYLHEMVSSFLII